MVGQDRRRSSDWMIVNNATRRIWRSLSTSAKSLVRDFASR
jgi:hypothetical protein